MFLLAAWLLWQAGPASLSLLLGDKPLTGLGSVGAMANAAMPIVAHFAALLLDHGDFARFAASERAMRTGNLLDLPVNFFVFALVTVVVTAGTMHVSGEAVGPANPPSIERLGRQVWRRGCPTNPRPASSGAVRKVLFFHKSLQAGCLAPSARVRHNPSL